MKTATESKNFNFTPAPGVSEIIIREGAAAVLHEPKALSYSGRLDSPRQFLDCKKEAYKPENATLVVDKTNNTITFYGEEKATPTDTVMGKLERNPDLEEFKLNSDKAWSFQELHNFLKIRRYFFKDKEAHKTLLRNLLNFKTQVTTVIENKQDNSGNRLMMLEQKIKDNPLGDGKFVLSLPLFKGYEDKAFTVEMSFSATDGAVHVYLLSDELIELLLTEREMLMKAEEDYFRLWKCAVITKS